MAEKQKYQISIKDSNGVYICSQGADKEEEIPEIAKQFLKNNGNRATIQIDGDNRYTIVLKYIVVDCAAASAAIAGATSMTGTTSMTGAPHAGANKQQLGCRNGDACKYKRNCKHMCKQFKEFGTCSRRNCAFHHFQVMGDQGENQEEDEV
jgi:hypothetical protein